MEDKSVSKTQTEPGASSTSSETSPLDTKHAQGLLSFSPPPSLQQTATTSSSDANSVTTLLNSSPNPSVRFSTSRQQQTTPFVKVLQLYSSGTPEATSNSLNTLSRASVTSSAYPTTPTLLDVIHDERSSISPSPSSAFPLHSPFHQTLGRNSYSQPQQNLSIPRRRPAHSLSNSWDGTHQMTNSIVHPSATSDLHELLGTVDEKDADQLTKLTAQPIMQTDRLSSQISEALNSASSPMKSSSSSGNTSSVVSPETEALSQHLKEQFEKKYQDLNANYNPLEAMRKRQEEKRNKIVKKYARKRTETEPANTSSGNLGEKATVGTVSATTIGHKSNLLDSPSLNSDRNPENSPSLFKNTWKSIFGKKNKLEKAGSDAKLSQGSGLSASNGSLVVPEVSISQKPNSADSQVSTESKKSPESQGEPESIFSSSLPSTNTESSTNQSTGDPSGSPTHKHNRRSSVMMSLVNNPWFTGTKKEESTPTSAHSNPLSPDTTADSKMPNFARIRQKIGIIRKSSSFDSLDPTIPQSTHDNEGLFLELKKTRSKRFLTSQDSPGVTVVKGKSANSLLKSEDDFTQRMMIKRSLNMDKFEDLVKQFEWKNIAAENEWDNVNKETVFTKRKRQLLNRVKRNKLAIFDGVSEHSNSKITEVHQKTTDLMVSVKEQFEKATSLIDEGEKLKENRQRLIEEIQTTSKLLSFMLHNDIKNVESMQNQINADISATLQKLTSLTVKINNQLVPELNQLRNNCSDLMSESNKARGEVMTEWGYSILAVVLNALASIIWTISVIWRNTKWFLRIDRPPSQQNPNPSAGTTNSMNIELSPLLSSSVPVSARRAGMGEEEEDDMAGSNGNLSSSSGGLRIRRQSIFTRSPGITSALPVMQSLPSGSSSGTSSPLNEEGQKRRRLKQFTELKREPSVEHDHDQ